MAASSFSNRVAAKRKAVSLHIGLNAVSGSAYSGWTGPLAACESDANDMAATALSPGTKRAVLLTKKATRAASADADTALAQVAASPRLTAIAGNMKAAVMLMSGCQDNQTSMHGDHNGVFTEPLPKVWNHGAFKGNYGGFPPCIKAAMPATQTPNLFTLGKAGLFLTQQAFALV